jgi:outer membrane receptor protein involved in Fe transport
MRRFSTATRLALTSSTIAIVAGFPGNAFAKEAPVETTAAPATTVSSQDVQAVPTNSTNPADVASATPASASSGPGITVTGSRIRRPNLESVVPVTSIQGEQFFRQGQTSVGDALNDLPQLRSTFAQQNPGLGIGIAGLNLLDLRGLAPKRTLVLVNGRRHVAADITSSASVPDTNSIPNDLIDRVDIVTGGNSAVYGSDAIAGVVNFILKRDFDGVQVRAQGAEAGAGFGTNYLVSALAGHNFGDGKGNVTVEAEYTHQDRVFGSDIPWLNTVDGFITADVDPGGLPHGSDGFPDSIFVTDIRQGTISYRGLIPVSYSPATAACGLGLAASNGPPSTVGGTPYNCNLIFLNDNSLVTQTGTRYSTGPLGGYIGGNGTTGREGQLLSILPKTSRLNLNLLAHYAISDAFEPFIEAKWSHQDVAGNNASSFGIQGTFGSFDLRERVRIDNPFLTSAQQSQIANAIIASGCNPSFTALCTSARSTKSLGSAAPSQGIGGPLNAADIAAINAGTYRFVIARTFADLGIRDEIFKRDTYRAVGGVRGTFNTDWSYELSANYGQFDETDTNHGFVDRQRLMLSLDAGRNPATGQIQCRAQYDPTAAVAFTQGMSAADATLAQQRLAADIAACVPYNPFGVTDNSAAANYMLVNSVKHSQLTQLDFQGFVNGDSSQLFSLPGGPVSFVLGGEYRRETARYLDDPFVKIEGTNNVIIGDFVPPAFHVAEAFGEINVPILKDMPFFHELTLTGAGRYSRYSKTVGDVWTYNFGGEWAPVRDIRFRGNFGKAVRAPNLSETAFPQVPNFAPNFVDPCTSGSIANNSNRTANCTADLGALLAGLPNVTQSLQVISGSNPLLKPEVSYSLTLGGVLQPRFIPGFSLSVDYYDIKVNKVIVALAAQQIANLCYDQPSLNNAYCDLFTRWRGPGTGPLGEQPGQILGNSLIQAGVNFAKRIRRGVDINANYRARLSSKVTLDTSLIWVHALKSSNYENPALPNFENRILGELGDPNDEGRLDLDLKVGNVTFGYTGHYIAPMYLGAQEDFGTLPAACSNPADPLTCPPNNADRFVPHKYPAISYHGLRFQWDTGPAFGTLKNIQVYAGVDNIFDKHAPFNLPPGGAINTDRLTGSQGAIYDTRGRNFYGGIKVRY